MIDAFVAHLFMTPQALSTWDAAFLGSGVSLSADGRTATFGGVGFVSTRSTRGRSTGKHYFEVTLGGGGAGNWMVGLSETSEAASNALYAMTNAVGWRYDNDVYVGPSNVASWDTFTSGDTICIAVDLAAERIWFRKGAAGDWNNSGAANPATGAGGLDYSALAAGTYFPTVSGANSVSTFLLNAGHAPFVGALPSGFYIWE